jgi:carbonic anhydrase/acetyltransferase-like protein (isoleucine patch superfamily)
LISIWNPDLAAPQTTQGLGETTMMDRRGTGVTWPERSASQKGKVDMIIEHGGRRPDVHPSAWIAPNAVVSGAVSIGAEARVLFGAVLTAEMGAEMEVGAGCVVMEQAVLRASGRFPLHLGQGVLVGPHAYVTGCSVGARSFIATGAMVFNGARLGEACVVALGGKVHIDSDLPGGTRVPIGFIAFGRPATIYPPEGAPEVHDGLARVDFMRYVFGVETQGKDRSQIMEEALSRYTRALGAHRTDVVL